MLTPDEEQQAQGLAEMYSIWDELSRRPPGSIEHAQLNGQHRERWNAHMDWRDAVKERSGGDQAIWGPAFDRVLSRAMELRGHDFNAGEHYVPHGTQRQ